jgi:hypothetical protein
MSDGPDRALVLAGAFFSFMAFVFTVGLFILYRTGRRKRWGKRVSPENETRPD